MFKEKGGEDNFFPYFQQEELSLFFLICICPYKWYNALSGPPLKQDFPDISAVLNRKFPSEKI